MAQVIKKVAKKAVAKKAAAPKQASKRRMEGPNPYKKVFRDARAAADIGRLPATRLMTLNSAPDISRSAGAAIDQRERDPKFASSQKVTAPPCLAMQTLAYMKLHCGLAVEFAHVDKNGRIITIPSLDEVRGVLIGQKLWMTDAGYESFASYFSRKMKNHINWMPVLTSTLSDNAARISKAVGTEEAVSVAFAGASTRSGKKETLKVKPEYFRSTR